MEDAVARGIIDAFAWLSLSLAFVGLFLWLTASLLGKLVGNPDDIWLVEGRLQTRPVLREFNLKRWIGMK